MARRKDFADDSVFNGWASAVSVSIDKKYYGQGTRIYLRRKRTANTALSIIEALRKLPLEAVRLHLTAYNDGGTAYPELIHIYEQQLIQARVYPESFLNELYAFYRGTARRILGNGELDLFCCLLSYAEESIRCAQDGTDEYGVLTGLMDILLQQAEFLREDSLDCTKIFAGVSTDGLAYEIDDPFPAIDLPFCRLGMRMRDDSVFDVQGFLVKEYRELGIKDIHTMEDCAMLNARSQIYTSGVICMSGFINEYTHYMIPEEPFTVAQDEMRVLPLKDLPGDNALPTQAYLDRLLRHRRQTLPANGVKVTFTGSRFYRSLTLKEIWKYGDLYLLYRLSTHQGDISGRYNTRTQVFVTPLDTAKPSQKVFILAVRGLVSWAYAAATCRDDLAQPTEESYHTFIDDPGMRMTFVLYGGRPRHTDGTDTEGPVRERDLSRLESKDVPLNGFIRKLPDGQRASEAARRFAEESGLELSEGETYVRPFTKRAWVLRGT